MPLASAACTCLSCHFSGHLRCLPSLHWRAPAPVVHSSSRTNPIVNLGNATPAHHSLAVLLRLGSESLVAHSGRNVPWADAAHNNTAPEPALVLRNRPRTTTWGIHHCESGLLECPAGATHINPTNPNPTNFAPQTKRTRNGGRPTATDIRLRWRSRDIHRASETLTHHANPHPCRVLPALGLASFAPVRPCVRTWTRIATTGSYPG
jgi:hypothetical protein